MEAGGASSSGFQKIIEGRRVSADADSAHFHWYSKPIRSGQLVASL